MAGDNVPNINYGGASDPGASTASNLGVGLGGSGVLPGTNFGYYGPTYNYGYYGPWPSGFGESDQTPYSANNWYRPRLGAHQTGPKHPFRGRHRGRIEPGATRLNDTLAVEPGANFAPGSQGGGDTYYGPSYNWAHGQDELGYASFGPNRGYGPGNWFNPETSPDYGGARPPWPVGSTMTGYGQPFSSWSGYLGTRPINVAETQGPAPNGANQGAYRGIGSRTYQRSDERIREDVSEALTDDNYVNAADVDVHVHDGTVTLAGTVADRQQKRRARDLAESVPGVKDVKNDLRLRPPGQVVGSGAEVQRGK